MTGDLNFDDDLRIARLVMADGPKTDAEYALAQRVITMAAERVATLPVADCGHVPTLDPDGRTASCHSCGRMWPLSYLAAPTGDVLEVIRR